MLYIICSWFLLFLLYSIIGYIAEIICVSLTCKRLVFNRGFLIGPYLPIYGFGALIMVLFLKRYESDLVALFIMGAFFCTVLEYFTSLVMEKIFKLRWWDYSDKKFNINGRVCLDNAILFGIGGVLVVKVVQPILAEFIYLLPSWLTICLAIFLFIVFISDIVESCYITARLKINVSNYIHKDATREIKKEVIQAIRKHTTLTSRLLKAFPNVSYGRNKGFMEFLKLFENTKKDMKIQKLKSKIKEEKKK